MFRRFAKKALKKASGVLRAEQPARPAAAAPSPRHSSPAPSPSPAESTGLRVGTRFASLDEIHETVFGPGPIRLINHWATWCAGCIDELELLVQLKRDLGEQVRIVGICWESFEGGMIGDDLIDAVQSQSRLSGLSWDSLLVEAPPPEFFDALGMECQTIPQVWLVDTEGSVVHRFEQVLQQEDADKLKTLALSLLT